MRTAKINLFAMENVEMTIVWPLMTSAICVCYLQMSNFCEYFHGSVADVAAFGQTQ
jgi:hypothetical protein